MSRFEITVNVLGTKNVVAKCETHGVQKLIYVSSVHAIPEKPPGEVMRETEEFNPEDVVGLYAKTKSEATREVLSAAKRGLNASVVHPSGIIGPYDPGHNHLTALIVDYVKGHLLCTVRGGYDFVDVRDVAEGILSCCEKGKPGECYILSNRFFSVQELFAMLQHVTGRRPIRFVMPQKLIETIAPLAELYYKILHRPPLFTAYSLYTLGSNALFSHEKADRELGYTARDINQTLADTVAWLRAQGYIK